MITHLGCWENMRKACKSRAEGEWFRSFLSKPIESMVYCFREVYLDYDNTFFWLELAWVAVVSVSFRPSGAKAKRWARQKGARLLHRLGLSVQLLCILSLLNKKQLTLFLTGTFPQRTPTPFPQTLCPPKYSRTVLQLLVTNLIFWKFQKLF